MSDYLTTCEQAARAGGAILLDWGARFTVQEKGPADLVTDADVASQEAIRRIFKDRYPDHGFVGEESGVLPNPWPEYCWVVDPLDGTTNYVHRVPHYAVSIALVVRGRPVVATVYDPVSQECYTAERGGGAWLNGKRITTSRVTSLEQAVIAASFSAKIDPTSPEINQFVEALLQAQAVRRTGSAALNLCYVAAGRFDAFWALTTKAWDVAAGALLVEEAGGVVTHWSGTPLDLRVPHPVAAATDLLHAAFQRLLTTSAGEA